MYELAELVFRSYKPLKLSIGMLFLTKIVRAPDRLELFVLEELPEDEEKFVTTYGYPVELLIIQQVEGFPANVLAEHHQIAWWDDGDNSEEDMREISIEDINNIINDYGGWVEIYMEDGEPYEIEDKVFLRYVTEEEQYEEEE